MKKEILNALLICILCFVGFTFFGIVLFAPLGQLLFIGDNFIISYLAYIYIGLSVLFGTIISCTYIICKYIGSKK